VNLGWATHLGVRVSGAGRSRLFGGVSVTGTGQGEAQEAFSSRFCRNRCLGPSGDLGASSVGWGL